MFRSDNDKHDDFMKTYESAAYANEGKSLFSYSDTVDGAQGKAAKLFGADADKLP